MNKNFQNSPAVKIFKQHKTALVALTLAVLFLAVGPAVLALETGLEYGTATGLSTQDIRVSIAKVIRVMLGLVGIIAIIIIIYAGFLWMTSAGNEEQISKAKSILRNAVIGLIIIFSAFSIVSFIIGMLTGEFGQPGPGGPGPLPPPCENCGHLGGGIIESVYPTPGATDIARDTMIIVTFKELMTPESIMDVPAETVCDSTVNNPCAGVSIQGDINDPVVKIYKTADGDEATLKANAVRVTSRDSKTFVFQPIGALGDSEKNNLYTTKLTNLILRDNGDKAFPGVNDYFAWNFEVGTKLDLVPPRATNVFPTPDNTADNYSSVLGAKATGLITISKQPRINQAASAALITACSVPTTLPDDCDGRNDITQITDPNSSKVNLGGAYNGLHSGTITFNVLSAAKLKITNWDPDDNTAGAGYYVINNELDIDPTTKRVELGHGIYLVFLEAPSLSAGIGQNFDVRLNAATAADQLQVSSKVFTFVAEGTANPGPTDIPLTGTPGSAVPSEITSLRSRIINLIDTGLETPNVDANAGAANQVVLTAAEAGTAGNSINIALSSGATWAVITPLAGGTAQTTSATCDTVNRVCDQPRNAVIRLDFSEGMSPTETSGRTVTDTTDGTTGNLVTNDFRNVLVQADMNGNNTFEADEYVPGTFMLSNQYRTIEFISLRPCLDQTGAEIYNSCGDKVYCLPVNQGADYTRYKVTLIAGALNTCNNSPECAGLQYESGIITDSCNIIPQGNTAPGAQRVCGNDDGQFFLKAKPLPAGLIDLANNSFDGYDNGIAQGPMTQGLGWPYNKTAPVFTSYCDSLSGNAGDDCTGDDEAAAAVDCGSATSCRLAGDDLVWTFYISNKVDLNAPYSVNVIPAVQGVGSSLIAPINSGFNKLLMSSSIKPGTGYADGKCSCGTCASGQTCVNNLCLNEIGDQQFCSRNTDCSDGETCKQRKYVSLYDLTTRPVAYWISNRGEDIQLCLNDTEKDKVCTADTDCSGTSQCGLKDNYADRNIVEINHTPFLESTSYSAEMGSGIKDIYQNCYVPGEGPASQTCDGTTGCCQVSMTAPFCCNGAASVNPCQP